MKSKQELWLRLGRAGYPARPLPRTCAIEVPKPGACFLRGLESAQRIAIHGSEHRFRPPKYLAPDLFGPGHAR